MKVYLAGPISHLSYVETNGWRKTARFELKSAGIRAYSPMRGKEYLSGVESMSPTCEGYADTLLSSPRAVMTRDRYDATRCDIMLVNLFGATRVSIGTVMEIAWADLRRIPIVLVMEPQGNPHEHAMIHEAIGYRVPTLDEAIQIVKAVLLP